MRLPFAPLDRPNTKALARRLGVNTRQVYRWRQVGVTVWQADRLAIAIGRHPAELWGDQWAASVEAAAA